MKNVNDTGLQTPLLIAKGTLLVPGKMYLRLYHGRTDPYQQMDDWGFVGPTFGPLGCYVHTYCCTFRIHGEERTGEVWLETHDDMIRWDGCYGDLEVFPGRRKRPSLIMTDSILDSLFHGCALRAYLEVYASTKQFPPDSETTRRRANQLYEEALAEKNRRKQPEDSGRSPLAKLVRVAKRRRGTANRNQSSTVKIAWMMPEKRLNKIAQPVVAK